VKPFHFLGVLWVVFRDVSGSSPFCRIDQDSRFLRYLLAFHALCFLLLMGFKSRRGRQRIHGLRMARFENGLIAEGECAAVVLFDHLYGATNVVRNSFQYLAALHRLDDESVAGRREFPRSDLKGLQYPRPVVLCPLVGIERSTELVQK